MVVLPLAATPISPQLKLISNHLPKRFDIVTLTLVLSPQGRWKVLSPRGGKVRMRVTLVVTPHLNPPQGAWKCSYPSFIISRKASLGTSTCPMVFIFFLPSRCFSSSLRLRVISPP